MSAINLNNLEEIKQQFQNIRIDTLVTLKNDIERTLSETMKGRADPEEDNMLCNEGLMKDKPQV